MPKSRDYLYYRPDLHRLNRPACSARNPADMGPVGNLLEKIFFREKKTEEPGLNAELAGRLEMKIAEIDRLVDWDQDLGKASCVVFDTETTGLKPHRGDRVISIGAVVVEGNRILNEPRFYRLVDPGRPLPLQAKRITGLSEEDLVGQEPIWPVLLDFLNFTGPRVLVAHNAPFDLAFINNRLAEAGGWRLVNPVIDTVLLASAFNYALGDYSLENLAAYYNLSLEGRHHALGDARIAAELFLTLLSGLREQGTSTLPQLAELFTGLDMTRGYPLLY